MCCNTAWAAGERQILPRQTKSTLYFPDSVILKVQYYKKTGTSDAGESSFFVEEAIFGYGEDRLCLIVNVTNRPLRTHPMT